MKQAQLTHEHFRLKKGATYLTVPPFETTNRGNNRSQTVKLWNWTLEEPTFLGIHQGRRFPLSWLITRWLPLFAKHLVIFRDLSFGKDSWWKRQIHQLASFLSKSWEISFPHFCPLGMVQWNMTRLLVEGNPAGLRPPLNYGCWTSRSSPNFNPSNNLLEAFVTGILRKFLICSYIQMVCCAERIHTFMLFLHSSMRHDKNTTKIYPVRYD